MWFVPVLPTCAFCSIVLPDVLVSLVKQLLAGVEFVLEERATQLFLHESFALACALPGGEANLLNNIVYVRDDAFNDDVRVSSLSLR